MRIPNQPNVERSEDPLSWVPRLNKFFLQVVSAFQSIQGSERYVTVAFTGTADRVVIERGASPASAVLLAKITDLDRPFDVVSVSGFYWDQDGSDIRVALAGLTAGRSYQGRFLIMQER